MRDENLIDVVIGALLSVNIADKVIEGNVLSFEGISFIIILILFIFSSKKKESDLNLGIIE